MSGSSGFRTGASFLNDPCLAVRVPSLVEFEARKDLSTITPAPVARTPGMVVNAFDFGVTPVASLVLQARFDRSVIHTATS